MADAFQRDRYDAVVVGAGPNGLSAAVELARHGCSVLLIEAADAVGGGAGSAALTREGFVHDTCSSVHPLAAGSPFFQSLPLDEFGLEWIHPPVPLAHPFDDEPAAILDRSIEATAENLEEDGAAYDRLLRPLAAQWEDLADEVLQPLLHVPRAPGTLTRFGMRAIQSADGLCRSWFSSMRGRALFAGIAAHSALPLTAWASASFGLILGAAGHTVGWPIPRGGAQSIADALAAYFGSLGGEIITGQRVEHLDDLPDARVVLLNVTPRQLVDMAGDHLPGRYRRRMESYRYGPAVFKIDYALSEPIPWRDPACRRAGTVHLGATMEEIRVSEQAVADKDAAEIPYVLLTQPSLFDPSRAPADRHTAWAYCHVPLGAATDMTKAMEDQIARFAPGFRDVILERHVQFPRDFERTNPNLIGGDIYGGSQRLPQLLARPVLRPTPYRVPAAGAPGRRSGKSRFDGLYLCSSSTPPGGGVHGMCGFHAASAALHDLF